MRTLTAFAGGWRAALREPGLRLLFAAVLIAVAASAPADSPAADSPSAAAARAASRSGPWRPISQGTTPRR